MELRFPREQRGWLRDLFGLLLPSEEQALRTAGSTRLLPAGDAMENAGECLIRVEEGTLGLGLSGESPLRPMLLMGPGDSWVAALHHPWPDPPYRLIAASTCRVFRVPMADLEAVLNRNTRFAAGLLQQACWETYWVLELIRGQMFLDVRERTAFVLLNLAAIFGVSTPDGAVDLGIKITQTELAELAGGSRAAVAGALKRFSDEGILVTNYGGIVIRDAPRLAARGGPGVLPFLKRPHLPGAGP